VVPGRTNRSRLATPRMATRDVLPDRPDGKRNCELRHIRKHLDPSSVVVYDGLAPI
jgi:hypothetical protein